MKNLIMLTTVVTLLLPPQLVFASSPGQNANIFIQRTLEVARQQADTLLHVDFSNALMEILQTGLKSDSRTPAIDIFDSQIQNIQNKLSDVLAKSNNNPSIGNELVLQLWSDYKDAVRNRFVLSFQLQEALYEQEFFLEKTELAIDRFDNICIQGRSEKNLKIQIPQLDNLPTVMQNIDIEYGVGDGSGVTRISAHSSTSTGSDQGRESVGSAIYGAAGITGSIVVNGGAGSTVAAATMAAPYTMGAAAVYAIYSAVEAAQKQQKQQNEIADANVSMFMRAATDSDVARFYRESCERTIRPLTNKLKSTLSLLRFSESTRNNLIGEALKSTDVIAEYQADAQEQLPINFDLTSLYNYASRNQCVEKSKVDKNSLCFVDGNEYVLARNSNAKLPTILTDAKAITDPLNEKAKKFTEKYPYDKQLDVLTNQLVLKIGADWNKSATMLNQVSLSTLDSIMSSVLGRIQQVFAQLRTQNLASWNLPGDPIFDEIATQNQFEVLKQNQRNLVVDGISVIFGRKDRVQFQKDVEIHLAKAFVFCQAHYALKEVSSFLATIKGMKQFYKNL